MVVVKGKFGPSFSTMPFNIFEKTDYYYKHMEKYGKNSTSKHVKFANLFLKQA